MAGPKSGERWMFSGAEIDFTVVAVREGRVYYHINRPEQKIEYDDIASMYEKTYKSILPSVGLAVFERIASRSRLK